jgi:hypothetical protein
MLASKMCASAAPVISTAGVPCPGYVTLPPQIETVSGRSGGGNERSASNAASAVKVITASATGIVRARSLPGPWVADAGLRSARA